MSFFQGNNPSRELGLYGYAAFLARQLDEDGIIRCAYCTGELTPANRALDHVEGGKGSYEDGSAVVAACSECNGAAGAHSDRAHEILAARLRGQGVDYKEAIRRVRKILRMPLPDRSDFVVVRIAEEHFGDRLQEQRKKAAIRRESPCTCGAAENFRPHKKTCARADRDVPTAGTGRTRARQLDLATGDADADDFDAF